MSFVPHIAPGASASPSDGAPSPDRDRTGLAVRNVQPVCVIARPQGDPSTGVGAANPNFLQGPPAPRDGCCIASAVCGLTAVVPFASQIAGIALGIAGLVRLRRAKRSGVEKKGLMWAVIGLVSSGLMLLCWLMILGTLLAVGNIFRHGVTDKLSF